MQEEVIYKDGFKIESLQIKHYMDVQWLFAQVFKKKVSIDFIQKKYNNEQIAIAPMAYIAYYNDMPVGFQGALTFEFSCGLKTEIGAQSVDTMVLKEFTRKGVFQLLMTNLEINLQKAGVSFFFGFPNQNSEFIVKTAPWQIGHRIQRYEISIPNMPIEAFIRKVFSSRKPRSKLLRTNDQFKSAFNSILDVYIKRNDSFLAYKSYTGSRIKQFNGIKVWYKIHNGLHIGDIENCSELDFSDLIKKLKLFAFLNGVKKIHFQTSPETQLDAYLSKICSANPSFLMGYNNYNSVFDLTKLKFSYADFDIF